jgi:hypothetical protein
VPAACRLIEGRMGHDLLCQAREAYARWKCQRETPITLRGVGGTLLEGTVDLAFEEDGEWKVIDFNRRRQFDLRPRGGPLEGAASLRHLRAAGLPD